MKIGIVGGGQLSRMLAFAGLPLGHEFIFLDQASDCSASAFGEVLTASFDDEMALSELAAKVDVASFDFENVPAPAMLLLEKAVQIAPPSQALLISQDRLQEKDFFKQNGFDLPQYFAIDQLEQLKSAVEVLTYPSVLKTRRLGYDGKGQFLIKQNTDIETAWKQLGSVSLILEQFVHFQREISIIAVRSRSGEIRFYPVSENQHRSGVLFTSRMLDESDETDFKPIQDQISHILNLMDYVGVAAFEFFDMGDGQLLLNEMAPRVHNSGHWTIEGAVTSQFENHIRAITDLPLGDTRALGFSLMRNIVGDMPDKEALLKIPDLHWHDYGKSPRNGRKIGHITLCARSAEALYDKYLKLSALLGEQGFKL